MISGRPIKTVLAVVAFLLWVFSLFLPVLEETGAGRGNLIPGYALLVFTLTWGTLYVVGVPWALMNLGLLALFVVNLKRGSSWILAILFAALATLVTLFTLYLARDIPQWGWTAGNTLRIGFLPWTASMFVMAAATAIGSSRARHRVPETGDQRSSSARF